MQIIKPYLKAWPLIILSTVAAYWFANFYLKYAIPMYESTAKVRLADDGEGVPSNNLFKDMDVFASGTKIAAEIEVMKSRVIIEQVLDKTSSGCTIYRKGQLKSTELYKDAPFQITASGDLSALYKETLQLSILDKETFQIFWDNGEKLEGSMDTPLGLLGGKIIIRLNAENINRGIKLEDQYEVKFNNPEREIAQLQSDIDITAVDKDVPVIRIIYKSPNAQKAADIVNAIASVYIEDFIKVKYEAAEITSEFLQNQINEVSGKLSSSENKIQDYRDRKDIINVHQETETDLRKISQLKIQETNLKMNLDAINELNQYISSGKDDFLSLAPNFEAFTDLLSTEMIKKIKELQSEKKELLLTYKQADLRVQNVDKKIKDYTDYLVESIQNTRNNLETKYLKLQFDIQEAEKVFIGLPEKERLLNIMNREFQLFQSSYMFLNNKKIEADIAKAAKNSFHRILNPGIVASKPVSPNVTIIKMVSMLLGFFGGASIVALKHLLFPSVKTVDVIETTSAISVIGTTQKFKNQSDLKCHFSRTAIHLVLKDVFIPQSIITFSSIGHKEGRGFHVHNFAEALALLGYKILVVNVENDRLEEVKSSHVEYMQLHFQDWTEMHPEKLAERFKQWQSSFDMVLVNNQMLENAMVAPLFLKLATTNIFLLDTRYSKALDIEAISLMADEYKLTSSYFILNRYLYFPNVWQRLAYAKKTITSSI